MEKVQDIDTWTYLFGPCGPAMLVLAQWLLLLVPAMLVLLFLLRCRHRRRSRHPLSVSA
jgi:hypothetical protein